MAKEKASYFRGGGIDQVSLQMGWIFSGPVIWTGRDFEQRTQKGGFQEAFVSACGAMFW